ncbi:MAG: stage 0 sporulation family protein [Clostridia bacterium]|nr:stage 0 sporulation family protein [Clostridia bacterium]
MTQVISVKFGNGGRTYYFDPADNMYKINDYVIVETANGMSLGKVSRGNYAIREELVVSPLKKVVRKATEKDLKKAEENKVKENEAFEICLKKIEEQKLEMKLIKVENAFDGSKITFFFTADGRVDFRELVKILAAQFHTRIELRQIGIRDEARLLGGIGICGQPYCCKQFLEDFQPVSIKMAKEQGLSLNPTKISGSCGRLMCCLKYEQNAYDDLIKTTPPVGATVKTPDGVGTVIDANLITGNLIIKPKEEDGIPYKAHRSVAKLLSRSKKQQIEEETFE